MAASRLRGASFVVPSWPLCRASSGGFRAFLSRLSWQERFSSAHSRQLIFFFPFRCGRVPTSWCLLRRAILASVVSALRGGPRALLSWWFQCSLVVEVTEHCFIFERLSILPPTTLFFSLCLCLTDTNSRHRMVHGQSSNIAIVY